MGTNRRAVVTNRPGCEISPQGIYNSYAERVESENLNKELKCNLQADRLSVHRFIANDFRLHLHAATLNLLIRLRQVIARTSLTPNDLGLSTTIPASALDEPSPRQFLIAAKCGIPWAADVPAPGVRA